MGVDAVDKQLGALREGDEAVANALRELDARLTEWLSAVRAGQAAIVAGLGGAVEPAEEIELPPAASPEDPKADATGEVHEHAAGEAGAGEGEPAVAKADEHSEQPQGARRGRRGGLFERPVAPGGADPAEEPEDDAAAAPGTTEEEEALLAELDEETASAIRVKRRLCNNKRSVQQLLEEIRAEQKAAKGKTPQRTQWWRRSHGQQGG